MAPLAWIRRIAEEVPEMNTIPLFGNAPSFNWEQFSSQIAARFGVSRLSVQAREQKWRERNEIKKGLGTDLFTLSISVAPLGTVIWMMPQEDLVKCTSWLMKPQSKTKVVTSHLLQEGFCRYLALESLDTLQEMQPFNELTLQLSEEEEPFEKAFCIDLEIDFGHKTCWGRLVIPSDFRTNWVNHFSQMPSEYVPSDLGRQIQLVLGVQTGSVLLHQEEWGKLKKGDFVLLDRGSYDPLHNMGIAMLMLGSTPVFNVKIHQNKIELADYAFYYEDNMEQKGQKPSEKSAAIESEKMEPAEGEVVALKELPLFVTVELARLKISLDQLMHLTPGNTLDLPIHPEQGVSLTVNGQKVGRGELVYLGEQLGVRILEIG